MATLEMASQAAGAVEDCADRATVFARIAGLLYRAGDESGATRYLSMGLTAARNIADEGTPRACMDAPPVLFGTVE